MSGKGNGPENHTFNKLQKSNPCCIKHWADLSGTLHLPAPTTPCFFHMYAIRSWFFVRFVTTHTETKTKWQRHSAVRKVKWKAKLLKHSHSHPDAIHNNAHPALGRQTRVETSAARPCLALHLSINKLWLKGPHSFPEMTVLSAANFVVRLFVVQPRTVVVQDDFEALFKRIFRRKITSAKMEKICWQITVAAFMQPLQYDLRSRAAKDNSITNAATARSNLDAAITMRSAETELQNTIELRTTASEIVAPKPDLDARAKKRRFWNTF